MIGNNTLQTMQKYFLTICLSCLLFTISFAQRNINPQKLLEDFDYAVKELRLQHQGFYNYEDKQSVDSRIFALRAEMTEPMTKLEFYQLIRRLLAVMNEGHGAVDLPRWTEIKMGLSKSFLPFSVRFLNRELIVNQNYGKDVEGLSRGTKILSINGKSIDKILGDVLPLIATDGFNETSKYEWLRGVQLSRLYRLVYGKSSSYELEVIDANSKKRSTVTIPAIRHTRFKSKNKKYETKEFNFYNFTYKQLNDSIAYLSVPDFGNDSWDYPALYKKVFRKISEVNIQHLILDIQANTGGTEGNENLLYNYLSEDTIRKYKKVTMLAKPYSKNKNDKDYIFDKWELKNKIAERGEFTCYSNYLSDLGYSMPNKNDVYKNKLYVLIGGLTFSGGAEFASMIKMTNRAIFIGDETGGAYEGNVSGYSNTVKLPNTKIKIDIPTVHFQIDVEPEIKGRGIIPDYEVPQGWTDYLHGDNAKLEFAKQLIMN